MNYSEDVIVAKYSSKMKYTYPLFLQIISINWTHNEYVMSIRQSEYMLFGKPLKGFEWVRIA